MLSLIPFDLHSMDSTHVVISPTILLDGSVVGSDISTNNTDTNTTNTLPSQPTLPQPPKRAVVSLMVSGIIEIEKTYLCHTGVIREVAGMALSCLLTRPDSYKNGLLDEYIAYCHELLTQAVYNANTVINGHTMESMRFVGVLYSIAQIYKRGNRHQLLNYSDQMLADLLALTTIVDTNTCNTGNTGNTENTDTNTDNGDNGDNNNGDSNVDGEVIYIKSISTRKLITKCIQRIGLSLLIPKVANWRYCLGKRTLTVIDDSDGNNSNTISNTNSNNDNGSSSNSSNNSIGSSDNTVQADDTPDTPNTPSIPNTHTIDESHSVACKYYSDLAMIIDYLCITLCDEDTIVRWSAAKVCVGECVCVGGGVWCIWGVYSVYMCIYIVHTHPTS